LQILFGLTFVWLILLSVLSYAGSIGKGDNKAILQKNDTHFVPAQWAFGIWSLIYIFQGFFVATMLVPIFEDEKEDYFTVTSGLIVLWFLEGLWLILYSFDRLVAAFVVMTLVWLAIGLVYFRVKKLNLLNLTVEYIDERDRIFPWLMWFLVDLPVSINFAWITIASLASLSMLLATTNGFSTAWSVIFITISTAISLVMLIFYYDLVFSNTIIFALVAILTKGNQPNRIVEACYVAIIVVAVSGFVTLAIKVYREMTKRGDMEIRSSQEEKGEREPLVSPSLIQQRSE